MIQWLNIQLTDSELTALAKLRSAGLASGVQATAAGAYADALTGYLPPDWQWPIATTEVLLDARANPALAEHAWDLCKSGANWPVLEAARAIGFTRLIEPDPALTPLPPVAPVEPLRVLFVIAQGVESDRLQPAEEYVGLVRASGKDGVAIRVNLLRDASPDSLRQELQRAVPHVVHFVAHGRFGGMLRLTDRDELNAQALASLLMSGTHTPWLVVLNACYSGGSDGISEPLAAGLVRLGVPAVVAMGDAVQDEAARTFAWRFYEEIAQGTPLGLAVTRGRIAVVMQGFAPPNSFEWARPALFRREGAELKVSEDPAWRTRSGAVTAMRGDKGPAALGDRHWLFGDPLRQVLHPAGEHVLLLHTPREFAGRPMGRSRLLRELGAALLREGHVVVHLDQLGNADEVTTMADLLRCFYAALRRARERYKLPPAPTVLEVLFQLARGKVAAMPLPPEVDNFVDGTNVSVEALGSGLRLDMQALRAAALASGTLDQRARSFVLIDELSQYGSLAAALAKLLETSIGTQTEPISVCLTLGPPSGRAGTEVAEKAVEDLRARAGGGRVVLYPVEPLAHEEARAAIVHWLLGNRAPNGAQAPLWPNPQYVGGEERVFSRLLKTLDSSPGRAEEVTQLFELLVDVGMLVPAAAGVVIANTPPKAGDAE